MKNLNRQIITAALGQTSRKFYLFCKRGTLACILSIILSPFTLFAQEPTLTYSSPLTYKVGATIEPLSPMSSRVAAVRYGSPGIIGSGFASLEGLAVDAAGNVYAADFENNTVTKIPAGGGAQVTIGSFGGPFDVAVDAAGNVYVVDTHENAIKKIPAAGGPTITFSGFTDPNSVAVDAAGNIYVTENYGTIEEVRAGSRSPVLYRSGFQGLAGICVDGVGNVYVTCDGGNGPVDEISADGGATITIDAGYVGLDRIAVDAAGNVYVAEVLKNAVYKFPAGGGARITAASVTEPVTVAIDEAGNLYVGTAAKVIEKYKPVGGYYINTPLPPGLSFDESTGIISGTPTAASPATNYTITAYNSSGSSSATVNIKVALSSNANLSDLQISTGTLSPSFAGGTTAYTASVPTDTASITLTPTTAFAKATVAVNGAAVLSGTSSAAIPLAYGLNTITAVVTAQDGTTTQTYTLTVTRPPLTALNNAHLAGLKLSNGTLSPAFAVEITDYTATVGSSINSIIITPTASQPQATITVNGQAVTSGAASPRLPLAVGQNIITTVVTAQDGVTTRTYTVVVTRLSANANLANMTVSIGALSPAFATGANTYTLQEPVGVTAIAVTPTAADPNATIEVNGLAVTSGTTSANIPLSIGYNSITVVVIAQDGVTTQTYTIAASRGVSDANLVSITLSSGAFLPVSSATTSYRITVGYDVSSVTLTPVTSSSIAMVTVDGGAVASGTASGPIAIDHGGNNIAVVVTAADGVTKKTYTITVTPTPADFAYLAYLSLNGGRVPYSPSFDFKTMNYTANVPSSISAITVTSDNFNDSESTTINGVPVTSHTASNPIALAAGANTITVAVTAEDGVTTQTYTVTVTRAPGSDDMYQPISASNADNNPPIIAEDIKMHQGVSPNGDGIDDVFTIDNINNYPKNNLMIMDRNGAVIYQAKGYDNATKAFDGHSNINGRMQLPGTYFYALDYTVNGITKRKTGFIVLKY